MSSNINIFFVLIFLASPEAHFNSPRHVISDAATLWPEQNGWIGSQIWFLGRVWCKKRGRGKGLKLKYWILIINSILFHVCWMVLMGQMRNWSLNIGPVSWMLWQTIQEYSYWREAVLRIIEEGWHQNQRFLLIFNIEDKFRLKEWIHQCHPQPLVKMSTIYLSIYNHVFV